MLRFLSRPYPRSNEISVWLPIILLSGFLVAVILFFVFSFQNDLDVSFELFKNLVLFGLVTIVCMSFTELLLPSLFKVYFAEERWTVSKNFLLWTVTLCLIAAGNMWMASVLYGDYISVRNFTVYFYYTLGIGFVINAVLTSFNYLRLNNKFTAGASLMTEEIKSRLTTETLRDTGNKITERNSPSAIVITSENGREKLEFSVGELLYIESADNYCKFFFLKQEKESSAIIRNSLKRIEAQVNRTDLFRCHRSYIVNLKKINSISGNSQGYRLKVNGIDKEIPVSRNSGKELSKRLKHLR